MLLTDNMGLPKGWEISREPGMGAYDVYVLTTPEGTRYESRISQRDMHSQQDYQIDQMVRRWVQKTVAEHGGQVTP